MLSRKQKIKEVERKLDRIMCCVSACEKLAEYQADIYGKLPEVKVFICKECLELFKSSLDRIKKL